MNEFGIALVWCAVQATLNLLAGAAMYLVVRRLGPAAGATAAATTLVMLGCVTLAAFSPWPRWWSFAASESQLAAVDSATSDSGTTIAAASSDGAIEAAAGPRVKPAPTAAVSFNEYWQLFRTELQAATVRGPSADTRWRWPAIAGALFVASAVLALGRFVIGLFALSRYRGRLVPVSDPKLVELCRSLARQVGCRRPIELKQSSTLSTPATMGWRRPVIVLPPDWQSWTDAECRVVLSHELAHVVRGDYLAWLLAKLAAALHVYHPLVHWLSGRLRLEQELAADAFAAELSGGRETYLFILAQMALRQDDRRVAWAARPFLPGRGTLLRRIEMLSETKRLRNVPVTRRRTVGLAAVAGLVALLVAGVRAPVGDGPNQALAAPPAKRTATPATPAAGLGALTYVPPRSVAVVAVRPADVLSRPEMQPIVKLLNDTIGLEKRFGLQIENLEEATLAVTRLYKPPQPGQPLQTAQEPLQQSLLYVLRYREAFDWKGKLANDLAPMPVEESVAGKTYYRSGRSDQASRPAFFLPDDRTIVVGPEIDLQRAILSSDKNKSEWAADWQKSATGQAAVMVDLTAIHRATSDELKRAPQQLSPLAAVFSPLWEKGQRVFLSLQLQDGLEVQARVLCANADDARSVEATLQAALTLARNGLDEIDRHAANAPAAQADALVPMIDLAIEALRQGKLKTEGNEVRYGTRLDLDVAETAIAVLTPAVVAARESARRAQAVNNMKQIMVAMNNYHDVYGHLPPPAVMGPDGKTPHSWRVAILPFVEGQQLYVKYKMDEPWDSPNNKMVLAQMPPVFRDPAADPTSQETTYFALVGPTTALGDKEGKGTKFQEITDGMSNTICIVEAKRAVPWTKPEDIDCDPAKPLPKLGGWHPGGFVAGFCDCSVRFLADTIDQQTLRAAITKAGGEPVSLP